MPCEWCSFLTNARKRQHPSAYLINGSDSTTTTRSLERREKKVKQTNNTQRTRRNADVDDDREKRMNEERTNEQHIYFFISCLLFVLVYEARSGLRDFQHKIFYFQVRFRSTQIARTVKRYNLHQFHFFFFETAVKKTKF